MNWLPGRREANMQREDLLARTFVELADVTVDRSDPTEVSQMLAQRCVELFETSAAGVLLADAGGRLWMPGSSSRQMRKAERSELRVGEGPCLESYQTRKPVVSPDLASTRRRWPRFAVAARSIGFTSVHAVPIHVQGRVIGALNLFRVDEGTLGDADMVAAELLARAMAIAVVRQPPIEDIRVAAGLQAGLEDQVVIEQAKGILAGRAGVVIDEAFDRICAYARYHDLSVTDVCHDVIDGDLHLTTFQEDHLQSDRRR
jgi:GAF domain-containing protein